MKKKNLMKTGLAGILLASMVLTGCGSAFAAEETEPYFEDDAAVIVEDDEEDPALPADESDSLSQNENAAPEDLDLASLGLVEEIGEEVSADMDASSIINNATNIALNTEVVCVPGQTKVYKFTPNTTRFYCVSSSFVGDDDDELDPYVRLYDQNGSLLAQDDDSGEIGLNFSLVYKMQAGTAYYILPGTFEQEVTGGSYTFKISSYDAGDNAEAISLGSSKTIHVGAEKVFYYQAAVDAVVEISVSSTQAYEHYYLKLADYDVGYKDRFFVDEGEDEDEEESLPTLLTIEAGHTMWFTLYGYNAYDDSETLTLTLTEAENEDADQHRYSGSVVEEFSLLPLSPDTQTVAKNTQVNLKVAWTVPGSNAPYFVWTINDIEQSTHGDTFTFLADGKNAHYSYDEDGDDYSYSIYVYMYDNSNRTNFYDSYEYDVYLSSEAHSHRFGAWVTDRAANALAAGSRHRDCSGCGFRETQAIPKLGAFIKLNAGGTLPMKTKQKFNKITAQLQTGDRIVSWKSSNPTAVTVDAAGGLKAGKKAGKATITATTAAGASASFIVKVQKAKVKTKKISVASKSVTLSKGQAFNLMTVVYPITSQDKVSYTTSDKKVAKVSKNGVITGKKKGKATITIKSGKKKFKVNVKVI